MVQAHSPQIQTAGEKFQRWWAQARTSFLWMVVIAFLLRLALIVIGHTYKFKAYDNGFSFGWEMGRIGRAIATGHGFADPFDGHTGPTAWEPPVYPRKPHGQDAVACGGVSINPSCRSAKRRLRTCMPSTRPRVTIAES